MATIAEYRSFREKVYRHLGGVCVDCGSEVNLHVHHIDPKKKQFSISAHWSRAWHKTASELEKCTLLCSECHRKVHYAMVQHGTLTKYRNHKCRCDICKSYYNDYHNAYRRKLRKSRKIASSSKGRT